MSYCVFVCAASLRTLINQAWLMVARISSRGRITFSSSMQKMICRKREHGARLTRETGC